MCSRKRKIFMMRGRKIFCWFETVITYKEYNNNNSNLSLVISVRGQVNTNDKHIIHNISPKLHTSFLKPSATFKARRGEILCSRFSEPLG